MLRDPVVGKGRGGRTRGRRREAADVGNNIISALNDG